MVAVDEHDEEGGTGMTGSEQGSYADQVRALEEEVLALRRRLQDAPKRVRTLEERLLETKGQLAQAVAQNEKLSYTLREAREHIATLRDEVDKLTQPPNAYGVVVGKNDDGTVDVLASGRKMKVQLHPDIDHDMLDLGAEVALNESFNVIEARSPETTGEVVTLKEVMDDGVRAVVIGRADEERVCELASSMRGMRLRNGDVLRLDPRSNMLLEKLRPRERAVYVLSEAFDYSYAHIAEMLEITEAHARQLASRARKLLGGARRQAVSAAEHRRLLGTFLTAASANHRAELEQLLAS